jgi:hypothetical protein
MAASMDLESWLAEVIAERDRILARIGPLPPPPEDRERAREEAVYRAAAALLEGERAHGTTIESV